MLLACCHATTQDTAHLKPRNPGSVHKARLPPARHQGGSSKAPCPRPSQDSLLSLDQRPSPPTLWLSGFFPGISLASTVSLVFLEPFPP